MNSRWRLPAIAAVTVMTASLLAACNGATQRCLPAELAASPKKVGPGDSLRLTSGPAECDLDLDGDARYTIVLYSSTAQESEPVEIPIDNTGVFSSEVLIPESFTPGIASVVVTGSPYDDCGDESGSCAQYSVDVTITP